MIRFHVRPRERPADRPSAGRLSYARSRMLTLNQLHCRQNFTLKPNQITEFSHNQESMKGLTRTRVGPKHTAHFVTHPPSRRSRLDFDELALEGTMPVNTSVKETNSKLLAKICVHLLIGSDPPRRPCLRHYRPDKAADRELRPYCEPRRRRMGSAPYRSAPT
jgi:hypothetical protein